VTRQVLEWALISDNGESGVEEMLLPFADDAAKQSALQICALHGLTSRLYTLLDGKCDPSSRDDDGWTALDWAILHGQEMFALELLRLAGPAVAHACHRSTKALARAARNRHLWQLAELLEFEPLATAQAAFRKILEDGTEEGLLELLLQGSFSLNPKLGVKQCDSGRTKIDCKDASELSGDRTLDIPWMHAWKEVEPTWHCSFCVGKPNLHWPVEVHSVFWQGLVPCHRGQVTLSS